jgi:MFS family permease
VGLPQAPRHRGGGTPAGSTGWGNVTFAVGLSAILIAVTFGLPDLRPGGRRAVGPLRRPRFATAGMLVFGASFVGLMLLPVDFPYWAFAMLIIVNGVGVGMFGAPNSSSIMGSVPPAQRGAASGIRSTFQNSGTALVAQHAGDLPPVSSLFAAVLGENPVQHLLQPTGALSALPAPSRQALTGKAFFPDLISGPFHHGLIVVFRPPPCCRCSPRSRRCCAAAASPSLTQRRKRPE